MKKFISFFSSYFALLEVFIENSILQKSFIQMLFAHCLMHNAHIPFILLFAQTNDGCEWLYIYNRLWIIVF